MAILRALLTEFSPLLNLFLGCVVDWDTDTSVSEIERFAIASDSNLFTG